ncbi:MAG: hypothetical protein HY534_03055 [Chloroflexi bacterium]|nr:hypothetical protein [Chloroflexota bacterium]
MPKKEQPKKRATEMTDDELAKRIFPPKVLEELKRVAAQEPTQKRKSSSQEDSK